MRTGWRYESHRHSMAARGIRTTFAKKNYKFPFGEVTVFDGPDAQEEQKRIAQKKAVKTVSEELRERREDKAEREKRIQERLDEREEMEREEERESFDRFENPRYGKLKLEEYR